MVPRSHLGPEVQVACPGATRALERWIGKVREQPRRLAAIRLTAILPTIGVYTDMCVAEACIWQLRIARAGVQSCAARVDGPRRPILLAVHPAAIRGQQGTAALGALLVGSTLAPQRNIRLTGREPQHTDNKRGSCRTYSERSASKWSPRPHEVQVTLACRKRQVGSLRGAGLSVDYAEAARDFGGQLTIMKCAA